MLTNESLDLLCRPSPHPQREIIAQEMSPLERFLGCVFMRRQLQRLIQNEEWLTGIAPIEPGMVLFRADSLQCQVFLNPTHMQSLHMKVSNVPPGEGKQMFPWAPEDMQTFEQFFDTRVAAPPYRFNELSGFTKMFSVPSIVLKDFIQIMKLEIMPELAKGLRWSVQFCLRVPPSATPVVPVGSPGVICRNKALFFLQISRQEWQGNVTSLILPMVYDVVSFCYYYSSS